MDLSVYKALVYVVVWHQPNHSLHRVNTFFLHLVKSHQLFWWTEVKQLNWNLIISDVIFNFRISKLYEKFVNETLFHCFTVFFRNLIWLFPWHSEGNYYWGLTFVNNNLCKCLCRLELSWCWFSLHNKSDKKISKETAWMQL